MERSTGQFVEGFYRKNYRKLYLHACSLLGRGPEAEVAVQEAFLAACKKPDEFINSQSHIGWLKKAVENEALHILREKVRHGTLYVAGRAFSQSRTNSFGGR